MYEDETRSAESRSVVCHWDVFASLVAVSAYVQRGGAPVESAAAIGSAPATGEMSSPKASSVPATIPLDRRRQRLPAAVQVNAAGSPANG